MNNDHSKTQNIVIIASSVRELKTKQEESEKRLRDVEISQGKTEVTCQKIDEKIDALLDGNKSNRFESTKFRDETSKKLENIQESISKQEIKQATENATNNTRWSILGKPISAGIVGGVITMGAKSIIDYIKHH